MHGLNLSTIPEIRDGAKLLNADGDLGGMRNLLPLPAASMFGAGKDPQDLRNLMRKLSARISREPDLSEERPEEGTNPNLPSGYTYLLQFIAHDMVNTSVSLAVSDGRRFGFQNARQLPLTLETIYGGGPDVSPQAYEYSQFCAQSRGFMPRTRFRCGRTRNRAGSTANMPFADIGRAVPVDVRDDGLRGRCVRTEALVADARNEDQALISQMTLLFLRMHNYIIDELDAVLPPSTAPEAYRNFICARFILALLYRRIIVKDVLYRLLDPSVYRYYFLPNMNKDKLASEQGVLDRIPVEFSHGAFRFGHAMVRSHYDVNGNGLIESARAMLINSRRSPGFTPLSEEWVVKWDNFFQINGGGQPKNLSRRLRPNFSSLARNEFFFGPLSKEDAPGLPNRDLISAMFGRIWSVPKLVDALRAKKPELAAFLPAYDGLVPGLTAWLEATGRPDGLSEQFEPGDVAEIAQDPPLPFFVLYEAHESHNGERLGVLGSIIIAETMVGAMVKYPLQVSKWMYDPLLHLKEQFEPFERLGVGEPALNNMPEVETFEDLLTFMELRGLLDHDQ
ncbi:peroxidase family protein [Bradyrhizobium sp. CB3481]|uniref:peroxidase family protein n=1 Tax=Bradyrhizobium sp. CB3481 TaxID=3039158 RepID=UPI0024B0A923|nr:peroxidase family protein [Bradyrhizobium sp. CB3481]WFU16567.1 peroxidase family protein [Bradyrhizobium sp. CB3481]